MTRMMIAICDEAYDWRRMVREQVERWAMQTAREGAVNIQTYASSEDLLDAWRNGLRLDMLFVDASFSREMSGVELTRSIHQVDTHLPVVFITESPAFACAGYEVGALRYLLKPVDQRQIDECLDIAWKRWQAQEEEALLVRTSRQTAVLPLRSIIYAEACGRSIRIATVEQGIVTSAGTFSDFENKLPPGLFARCHRRYLANLMYVRRITSSEVLLVGGEGIPVGRKYSETFMDSFNRYYQGRQW